LWSDEICLILLLIWTGHVDRTKLVTNLTLCALITSLIIHFELCECRFYGPAVYFRVKFCLKMEPRTEKTSKNRTISGDLYIIYNQDLYITHHKLWLCVFAGSSKYLNKCITLISDWLTFSSDLFFILSIYLSELTSVSLL